MLSIKTCSEILSVAATAAVAYLPVVSKLVHPLLPIAMAVASIALSRLYQAFSNRLDTEGRQADLSKAPKKESSSKDDKLSLIVKASYPLLEMAHLLGKVAVVAVPAIYLSVPVALMAAGITSLGSVTAEQLSQTYSVMPRFS